MDKNTPWIEKYRPKSLSQIASQDEIVQALTSFIAHANLPHMLFYGPPGTGKTSAALALAKDLFGPDLYKQRVLELNASDERGIQVVRDKIKTFAKLVANEKAAGYPCPPYKLIILDEADSMTSDAQSALRRVMETYSQVTRFVIICNYVTKIIDPVTSRCAKFRFRPLPQESILSKLGEICQAEGLLFSERLLEKVNQISGGDMRRSIMFLQGASKICTGNEDEDELVIDELTGRIPDDVVDGFWSLCTKEPDLDKLLAYLTVNIIRCGYNVGQFLDQALGTISSTTEISSIQKANICLKLASVDYKLTLGADERLQLADFGAFSWKAAQQPTQ